MANTIQGQRTVVKDIEDKEGRHCKTCRKTLSVDLFYKRKNGRCELVCKKSSYKNFKNLCSKRN